MSKNVLGRDYVVPPLEALWWADDMRAFTSAREKAQWKWTLLLFVPDWLTTEHVQAATEAVRRKKNVPAQGLTLHGLHHEIYLTDPRRTEPERLRTILRQPVRG